MPPPPPKPSKAKSQGDIFRAQVKVLVKKDLWLLKKHKKATFCEVAMPICVVVITALLILQGISAGNVDTISVNDDRWRNTMGAQTIVAPPSIVNTATSPYIRSDDVFVYPNETAALDNFTTFYETQRMRQSWYYREIVGVFGPTTANYSTWLPHDVQINVRYYQPEPNTRSILFEMLFDLFNPSDPDAFSPTMRVLSLVGKPTSNQIAVGASIGSAVFSLAFLAMFANTSGKFVDEKKSKMREHLRIMGVRSSAYILAIFISSFLRLVFVSICIIIAIYASGVDLPSSAIPVYLLSVVLFGMALVSNSMFISCFFRRSSFATAISVLYLLAGTTAGLFVTDLDSVPLQRFFIAFFTPVPNVLIGAQVLANYSFNLAISVPEAFFWLAFQIVFYALLGQYIYLLNPGEYGVPQKVTFPIYQLMRCFRSKKTLDVDELGRTSTPRRGDRDDDIIVLKGLVKKYGNSRAVDGLDLSVHRGEIFALLGHNGAGKTTTISMLTGMAEPSSYKRATINGHDLKDDIDLIRHEIGTCPQFDILFDELSGPQHLEMFAAIKGRSAKRAARLLDRLRLPGSEKTVADYSGGMKRRLSVACAFIGGAPVIFLDEPSSGLDPLSRRQLWDMIHEEKARGKTVILTTHFMEEADYLGDRIAIMSHGKLYCCDTSSALKHRYGVGFYLTFAKEGEQDPQQQLVLNAQQVAAEAGFSSKKTLDFIERIVPGTTLSHESMGEAMYLLPHSQLQKFGDLLEALDDQLPQLHASSYGIRMNSLDDVFVSISEQEELLVNGSKDEIEKLNTSTLPSGQPVEDVVYEATRYNSSIRRFLSQVGTVMLKKFLQFRRSLWIWVLCVIIPLLLLTVGFLGCVNIDQITNMSNAISQRYSTPVNESNLPPNFHRFVVPTLGPLSQRQKEFLHITSILYKQHLHRLEPSFVNVSDADIVFPEFSRSVFSAGTYLHPTTISPTGSGAFIEEYPMYLVFGTLQKPDYSGIYVAIDIRNHHNLTLKVFFNHLFRLAARYNLSATTNELVCNMPPCVFPNVQMQPFVIPVTDSPTMAPTPGPNTTSAPGHPTFRPFHEIEQWICLALPIVWMIITSQFCGVTTIQVADELKRETYMTMRMHGLSALAYWTGTFLFDWLLAMTVVGGGSVAGVYIRDVPVLQNAFIGYMILLLGGFISFSLLLGYAFATVFPQLKHSIYFGANIGFSILLVSVPLIMSSGWTNNGKGVPNWVLSLTPQVSVVSIFFTQLMPYVWNEWVVPAWVYNDPQWDNPWNANSYKGQVERAEAYLTGVRSLSWAVLASVWLWALVPILRLWLFSTAYFRKIDRYADDDSEDEVTAPRPFTRVVKIGQGKDEDVLREETRVLHSPEDNLATTVHLRGAYKTAVAVRDMTFGVRSGECFGLLGPNGAGKTTTVKLLLHAMQPTNGYVEYPYVGYMDPKKLDSIYEISRLGVCQQGDSLWETLTAQEHMEIFLRIRVAQKYDHSQWKSYIHNAVRKVYLDDDTKQTAQYSGGMKRKLAVCIAMYTGARVVFLDEPSTGMDPYARRAMWTSINDALEQDRCVLLTTHSMEEADAVCSRIAIVTDGDLKCIGSGQHLKSRFGTGFCIQLFLKPTAPVNLQPPATGTVRSERPVSNPLSGNAPTPATRDKKKNKTQSLDDASKPLLLNAEEVEEELDPYTGTTEEEAQRLLEERYLQLDAAMKTQFGYKCERTETLGLTIKYTVPELTVSTAFKKLAACADEFQLDSYSVNQVTSLEHIFVNFAMGKTVMKEE